MDSLTELMEGNQEMDQRFADKESNLCQSSTMAGHGNHCSFVLLAEFHILEGAQLKYQFPQPLGIDEG
jgi:hypothetical protein